MFGSKKPAKAKLFVRTRQIIDQSKRGRTSEFGFLHVPKTGGSAFSGYSRKMVEAGYTMPVKFGHVWSLGEIVQSFPNTKVSFMIRDPLERTISAFNSRLRQGRPRFTNNWGVREAVAFSLFSNVNVFLKALISKEDHDVSAVNYAFHSIKHLRLDYGNYFISQNKIELHRSAIHLVGEVDNSIRFWEKLSTQVGVPIEIVEKQFKREHVSGISSREVLLDFSDGEVEAMKNALRREYKIYDALKKLVNC